MGKRSGGGGNDPFPRNTQQARELTQIQEDALNRALQRSAELNFFDISTPFGSRTFLGRPGSENFRQIEQLSPFGQDLRRLGRRQVRKFGDLFTDPIGGRDLSQARSDVESAFFERGENLLRPGFERQQDRLENQLIQRGLPRSGEAFQTEQEFLDRRQNEALENLALQSVAAGGAEQSRLISDDLRRRGGLLGELGFFGGGGLQPPSFQPTPTLGAQAPDTLGSFGLLNQNIQAQNAQRQQQQSDLLGGLFGLGSAGILGGTGFFG